MFALIVIWNVLVIHTQLKEQSIEETEHLLAGNGLSVRDVPNPTGVG